MRIRNRVAILCALWMGCAGVSLSQGESEKVVRESRGVWFEKGEMLEGRVNALARLDRLKEAGFNSVYVATQVRGFVMYPGSGILPQWEGARKKEPDVLAWLVPAIHERGMKVEAWTEFGFYAYHTPDATKDPSRGAILDKHPELTSVDADGNLYLHNEQWGDFYSLCPANPKAQEILTDLYLEMLQRYDFDGLNLDRIRFASERFCHCDYCKRKFREDTGLELKSFAKGTKEWEVFNTWRKNQLNAFMKRFSAKVRSRFPNKKITSAVVPPYMIDDKAQDWPTWVREGYLDAAMPMLYGADISEGVTAIERQVGPKASIFYGLDAGQGVEKLKKQMKSLQQKGAPGVTIWYSKTVDPMLPELKAELFLQPAVSPLYSEARESVKK